MGVGEPEEAQRHKIEAPAAPSMTAESRTARQPYSQQPGQNQQPKPQGFPVAVGQRAQGFKG
jgi:hypothetical protein